MAKFEIVDPENKIAFLSFADYKAPYQEKDKAKGFVKYGKNNDFPNELIRYYNEHPEHNAIVGAKARYLFGEGLEVTNETQKQFFEQIEDRANRFESYDEMLRKCALDCELFNSFYIQVITDLAGKPLEYYHLQFANCRLNEDGNILYYSDDFLDKKCEVTEFKMYQIDNTEAGTYFLRFEFYQPKYSTKQVYVLPEYKGALKEIKSDIDISTFNSNYITRGFSAATLVTFFNGEPSPDQKRVIKDKLTKSLTGVENAGEVVINYADKDGQAAQITALNVDDLDKKFEFISKHLRDKITVAHNVTNQELFGIKTEGQLGTRVSLIDSYDLFLNTYTKPRQKNFLEFIEFLFQIRYGVELEIEFKELKPIGLDLSNDADLTQDERRELKGYAPLTAAKLDANGQPVQVQASNDSLRGLSASENADLYRIIRDYNKGKLPEALAITRVKAYGLTDDEAKSILGIEEQQQQFSSQDFEAKLLAKFDEIGIELDFEHEVLFEEEVKIKNSNDALKYELKAAKMAFATISITELDNAVLNAIKGNPSITNEQLAKMYGVTVDEVLQAISRNIEKGLIEQTAKGYIPNQKAIDKATEPIATAEIKTFYYYKLASDAPRTNKGKVIKPRQFCQSLLSKGKYYTFEQIDNMSNNFAESLPDNWNAWDYRGGFFTNGNTGETTPFCRHVWAAKTIKVIKKK